MCLWWKPRLTHPPSHTNPRPPPPCFPQMVTDAYLPASGECTALDVCGAQRQAFGDLDERSVCLGGGGSREGWGGWVGGGGGRVR